MNKHLVITGFAIAANVLCAAWFIALGLTYSEPLLAALAIPSLIGVGFICGTEFAMWKLRRLLQAGPPPLTDEQKERIKSEVHAAVLEALKKAQETNDFTFTESRDGGFDIQLGDKKVH